MSKTIIQATQFGYVKRIGSENWSTAGAMQGQYTGSYPRVGVMLFGDLHSIDWADQVVSKISMELTFAGAGYNREKTISMYRGAKSTITGTGESMIGSKIGDFKTGGAAYNSTLTIEFSASANVNVFLQLVSWLQDAQTNTLTIYRDETTTSTYTENYLQITAAALTIEHEPAGSSGTLDKSTANAGEQITLTITPIDAEGEITHDVEWTFGSMTSGQIALTGALTASFAFPLDWLTEIPDAVSGTAHCKLTTYVDGEAKATRAIPITLTVPASIVPDFDVLIIPNGTTGGYWQHLGGAKITILDPVSFYGATIKSYSITGTEGVSGSGSELTTPTFTAYGNHVYTVRVTDSRGRSATMTASAYVNALGSPQIDAFSVRRYAAKIDDSGETVYAENLSGGHVWFTIDASIDTASGNNTPTAYIVYAPAGGKTTRIDIDWPAGEASFETENDRTILTADIPLNAAYEFRLYVEDEHSGASWPGRVEKSGAIMHYAGTGYGVSIGGFSGGTMADKRFDVAAEWTSHFPGGIYGYGDYRMDRAAKTEILEITHASFAPYSDELTPRITRVGPIVFLDGQAKNTADLDSGFDEYIATLPEWARPAMPVSVIQQGSSATIWWLRIYADGGVRVHRYRSGGSYTDAAAGCQFPLTACWLAADAFLQTYSISGSYTRCTTENTAESIAEGKAYVAKLIPELGTEITSISITMGDSDAGGYYENNLIHIPIVTGDITITAIAEETPAALIQVSDDGEGNVTASEVIDGSLLHEDADGAVTITKYATATASDDGSGNIEIE